ncbi:MAG: TonB C-terminal domain-containing protein [Nannocystis sp.]|nr:TonB C-terminal domain-containing protein [Nannocystis sp.]MBA3545101.1 TonB C-terminal domain-containing protein [Nannocystis sp.]
MPRPKRDPPPLDGASPRRRRGAGPLALATCLLISGALNFAGLLGSLVLLDGDEHQVTTVVSIKQEVCVDGETRRRRLFDAALSGEHDRLLGGIRQLIVDGECEPKPMVVALVDEPREERDPLEDLTRPEPEPEPLRPKPRPKDREKPLPTPEPEPEKPPEPEKEKPPEPEPEQPQEKIDFELQNLKMVEQLEEKDEKDAPKDVHYLSNINRDVTEETRSEISNLHKDADKAKASQQEPSKDPEKGHADENKIAELQEQKSRLAQEAPKVKVSPVEQRPAQNDPNPKTLLSMRELPKREHSEEMLKNEAQANEAMVGELSPDRTSRSAVNPQTRTQQGATPTKDKQLKFRLSKNDLDAMFGREVDAQKAIISQRESKKKGIWEEQRERYQSPLENMVPEVRPGNQTALRSRKHPFAQFIATMHRTIHDKWAYNFLEQLDTMGRGHPLNKGDLWTRVEIVLLGDGTIDKVRTVRYSGNQQFDGAAREVVFNSAPYPTPPREILSPNGKVYIHWAFHRDERACGTFGAEPFILDGAGQGERPDPNRAVRPASSESEAMSSRRLARQLGPAGGPEGPAPPPHKHAPGEAHNHPPQGGGGNSPPPSGPPTGGNGEEGGEYSSTADPAAAKSAEAWLKSFATGDASKLASRSSLPFYVGDRIVARTREELTGVLTAMIEEARGGSPSAVAVHTAAGLRKLFGSVPSGVMEGLGRNYGVTKIGGEVFIVLLEKHFGTWKVVGVAR